MNKLRTKNWHFQNTAIFKLLYFYLFKLIYFLIEGQLLYRILLSSAIEIVLNGPELYRIGLFIIFAFATITVDLRTVLLPLLFYNLPTKL